MFLQNLVFFWLLVHRIILTLLKVMVEEGAAVAAGDPLMVMIAMKMEYVIKVNLCKNTNSNKKLLVFLDLWIA